MVKQYLFPVFLSMVIVTVGYFFLRGIPLFGIPRIEDISCVEISDEELGVSARTFTEIEDIEKAVNIVKFLNYELGTPKQGEPFITITYRTKDDAVISVSANEETVYWNGRAYTIKGDAGTTFVKITEGLFFYDVLVEKESSI